MSKQVRETAAGKSVSAYVILNRKGEHVADVQAHFSDSGTVAVDVWNHGDGPCERSARAMGYKLDDAGRISEGKHAGQWPYRVAGLQQGRAGGYGYDKFTAALSGLVIDGHVMSNHCDLGKKPKPPKGLQRWPRDAKPPKGYAFANYQARFITFGLNPEKHEREGFSGNDGYESCYRLEGLKYLEAFGYRVIQAI